MNILANIERALSEIERDVDVLWQTFWQPLPDSVKNHIRETKQAEEAADWFLEHYDELGPLIEAAAILVQRTTVYFIRRADGSLYASTENRHRYGEIVIDTTQVNASPYWSIQTSPVVADHLKRLSHAA